MADTGHLVSDGFGAGAIAYVVLEGLNPDPVTANVINMGFGTPGGRLVLDGFHPGAAGASGAFYIFGETVIQ